MSSEQKPWWKKALWVLLIVAGVGILGQLAYSSYTLLRKQDIIHEREAYRTSLETEQVKLKTELSHSLQAGYIEREARNKLGLARPGETVVIMPESTKSGEKTIQSGQPQNESNEPNWKKWLRLFF